MTDTTDTKEVREIERHLATIEEILDINPIPDADKIEVVSVKGWKVVVKKGAFKVGDKCVFFEIDSLIPGPAKPWNQFLWDKGGKDTSKPIRLKTVRLRKQVSQGLAVPIAEVFEGFKYNGELPIEVYGEFPPGISLDITCDWQSLPVGTDVTELLGVKKWQMDIPAQLAGRVKGNFPGFLIKTDVERIQNCVKIIDELQGVEVYVTIKVDGTSFTAYHHERDTATEDKWFGVCSRNLELTETEENLYWKMARQYNLRQVLKDTGMSVAVQAEVFGMGIQKNKMGSGAVGMAVFDVFDIREHKYFDYQKQVEFCDKHGLTRVPTIYVGPFKWKSVDELIEFANAQRYSNGTIAEGIVIRPVVETYSNILRGRTSIKVISPEFLLKYGE